MTKTPPDLPDRSWLQDIVVSLIRDTHPCYGWFLHRVSVQVTNTPFVLCGGVPVPACVLGTDDGIIRMLFYWPAIKDESFAVKRALLKHEIFHVFFGHCTEHYASYRDTYGNAVFGLAIDLVVDQCLDPVDIEAFAGTYYPATLPEAFGLPVNKTVLEYCELLTKESRAGKPKGKDKTKKERLQSMLGKYDTEDPPEDPDAEAEGAGGQPADGDGDGEGDGQPGGSGDGDGDGTGTGAGTPTASDEPPEIDWEKARPCREVFDIPEAAQAIFDQALSSIVAQVHQEGSSSQQGLGRGFDSSEASQVFSAMKRKVKTPWQQELKLIATGARDIKRVYAKRRPSRRHPDHIGRLRRKKLQGVVLIDTSGSMGKRELELVDSEMRHLHQTLKADLVVFHCDAGVAKQEPYNPREELTKFFGRGGTDFSPALIEARKLYPMPTLFVGFTDGYGSVAAYRQLIVNERGEEWMARHDARGGTFSPDGMHTVWLLPQGNLSPDAFKKSICPWGRTIEVIP